MNERQVANGLSSLPFLYVAAILLPPFVASAPAVLVAFGLSLAISLLWGGAGERGQGAAAGLSLVLAVLLGVSLAEPGQLGDLAAQLTAGILIGVPFIVLAFAWDQRASVAGRTVVLAGAMVIGTGLLATRAAILKTAVVDSPSNLVQGFFGVNVAQVRGLVSIATGSAAPDLPLRAVLDPTFVALAAFAVVGVVLLVLRPRSGLEVPLPVTPASRGFGSLPDRLVLFSGAQRAVFESRSRDEPPAGAWPPGLGAVVIAALGSCGLLLAVFALPFYAPLILTLGIAAIFVVLGATISTIGSPRETPRS